MTENDGLSNACRRLVTAILSGKTPVREAVRQCFAAGLSVAALQRALIAAESEMVGGGTATGADAARRGVADRLGTALDEIAAHCPESSQNEAAPLGVVAIATLPGDGHHVGPQLWQMLLTTEGYAVHKLGRKAPVILARDVAALRPDALALNLFDTRSRTGLQSLVAGLLRQGLQVPLLLGGPGVDEAFAQRLAIAAPTGPYWGGVYYCADGDEMLQVLKQIVLFEPPAPVHSHSHGTAATLENTCESCGGCALAESCDQPVRS